MAVQDKTKTDTPSGVSKGAGGETGPKPELQHVVTSGDRNSGEPGSTAPVSKGPPTHEGEGH